MVRFRYATPRVVAMLVAQTAAAAAGDDRAGHARLDGSKRPRGWRSIATRRSGAQRLAIDAAKADETTAALEAESVAVVRRRRLHAVLAAPDQPGLPAQRRQLQRRRSATLFERGGKREKRTTVAQDTTDVTRQTCSTRSASSGSRPSRRSSTRCSRSRRSISRSRTSRASPTSSRSTASACRPAIWREAEFYKISLQKLQFEQDVSAAEVGAGAGQGDLRQLLGFETVADDFDVDGDLALRDVHAEPRGSRSSRRWRTAPTCRPRSAGVQLAQDT